MQTRPPDRLAGSGLAPGLVRRGPKAQLIKSHAAQEKQLIRVGIEFLRAEMVLLESTPSW